MKNSTCLLDLHNKRINFKLQKQPRIEAKQKGPLSGASGMEILTWYLPTQSCSWKDVSWVWVKRRVLEVTFKSQLSKCETQKHCQFNESNHHLALHWNVLYSVTAYTCLLPLLLWTPKDRACKSCTFHISWSIAFKWTHLLAYRKQQQRIRQ